MDFRKWFVGVLAMCCSCNSERDAARKAYFDEASSRGYSEEKMLSMQPGMEARYTCGCNWKIGIINSGRFGGCPVPPPRLCHTHGDTIIGWKWPEDWNQVEKETP